MLATLFRKINDIKAIACNNAANILLAMIQEPHDESDEQDMISISLACYDEAMEPAQEDFHKWTIPSDEKASYASQLADRLFNRGLFLLLISRSRFSPPDARERGCSDIAKTRALDYDVKDFWLDHRAMRKNSVEYFDRLIRRIKGLSDLKCACDIEQVWDIEELIDDADNFLFAAWNETSAPLFREINRVGRLQQLESAAILFLMRTGNEVGAARLAIQMLNEDEFILEDALRLAFCARRLCGDIRTKVDGERFREALYLERKRGKAACSSWIKKRSQEHPL